MADSTADAAEAPQSYVPRWPQHSQAATDCQICVARRSPPPPRRYNATPMGPSRRFRRPWRGRLRPGAHRRRQPHRRVKSCLHPLVSRGNFGIAEVSLLQDESGTATSSVLPLSLLSCGPGSMLPISVPSSSGLETALSPDPMYSDLQFKEMNHDATEMDESTEFIQLILSGNDEGYNTANEFQVWDVLDFFFSESFSAVQFDSLMGFTNDVSSSHHDYMNLVDMVERPVALLSLNDTEEQNNTTDEAKVDQTTVDTDNTSLYLRMKPWDLETESNSASRASQRIYAVPTLNSRSKDRPFLGICLGIRLFFNSSEESPRTHICRRELVAFTCDLLTSTTLCIQKQSGEWSPSICNYGENFSASINKPAVRLKNVVGRYHSLLSYGCWLSGLDVSTQMFNQQITKPFLAVVIVSVGKVEMEGFRAYLRDYKSPEFGFHCKQYCFLDIAYFKSSLDSHLLDLLWNKYWVNMLSSSLIQEIRVYVDGQIFDLADQLEKAEGHLTHSRFGMLMPSQ